MIMNKPKQSALNAAHGLTGLAFMVILDEFEFPVEPTGFGKDDHLVGRGCAPV
jgi:hypothetical protein